MSRTNATGGAFASIDPTAVLQLKSGAKFSMHDPTKLARRRKQFAIILVGVTSLVAFALSAVSSAQTRPPTATDQPTSPRITPAIKVLLIQKRDVLKRRHKNVKALYESGHRDYTFEQFFASELDLLEAELELATSSDERRRILASQLAVRRSVEDHVRKLHELHVPDPHGVRYLKSTADRIDAEIALARESPN